ncbi:CoA ester lyase [Rhodococcus triatomae]|uniref:Citrate lyase subunit beta / citryl-CoA lyase n=1 Tax=Rhodococcus triatomae TaxID=300028 RepID=A0A1G8JN53_9NOCA|nr:CoA ester lyase [Rhodococcus triatomae]QNG19675.1 CoA ester lyase [Rhodococcus triatomae]QNG24410.1 CoA ester lyase [Rhodococcus triatomae]SDI32719.1 citrate lyase subunit beta / citryl-CoA lyase [Rhodococcus triatomae]
MSWQLPGPAWLFCPADRPDRYAKAAAAADVVILDLEDAVAPADKEKARTALIDTPLDPDRTVVRVNAVGTDDHERDLLAIDGTKYTRVMLPKCESADQVLSLAPGEVIALVESPQGALAVEEIALAANAIGVMWGAEDLVAALGGNSSRDGRGVYRDVARHVRSSTLLAAKAYHRIALDSVYLDFADLDGLRAESDDAVAVGFDVKVAIHPTQVGVIRAAYTPTDEDVSWARSVLAAAEHENGVFAFEGKMVDSPVLHHAEHVLRRIPTGQE